MQSASSLPTTSIAYLPHASVEQPELKTALSKIAVVCQFLDAAFAEYFRVVISPLQGTRAKLQDLREQICSCQSDNINYILSLGEYCERINPAPGADMQTRMGKYQARATGDVIHPHSQDALDVPYWDMMAGEFVKSNQINTPLTYDAILSVINDKRRELKRRLHQAKQKWHHALPQVIEDGIARRTGILDGLLAQTSDKYDSSAEQQVQALQRSSTSRLELKNSSTNPKTSDVAPMKANASSADNVTDLVGVAPHQCVQFSRRKLALLSLFSLFTAIAMVPFGTGFACNWNAEPSDAIGSTSDPDFKWLIAATLPAIFGNIYAVVAPSRNHSWLCREYI